MDRFVENLAEGELDDADLSFTINRERALELAKTLQLPERRAYVLKLVQWAVTCEPKLIRVTITSTGLIIEHDGEPPSLETVNKLRQGVVDFSHLSMGVFGALGLQPDSLVVSLPERGWELCTGQEVESLSSSGLTCISISGIQKKLFERSPKVGWFLRKNWHSIANNGPLQKLILDAAGIGNLEAALIRTYCGHCRVPLELNGAFVNSHLESVASAYNCQWDGEVLHLNAKPSPLAAAVFLNYLFSDLPGEVLAPLEPGRAPGKTVVREQWLQFGDGKEIDRSLLRGSATPSALDVDGRMLYRAFGVHRPNSMELVGFRVLLVKDGVVVDSYLEPSSRAHGKAHVSANGLKTSADGFSVVKDQDFEEFRLRLEKIIVDQQVTDNDTASLLAAART